MLKGVGVALLAVWMFGSTISGISNNINLKRDCIEQEGFVKGWLWCSHDTRYSFGLEMAKGALWPYELLESLRSEESKENEDFQDVVMFVLANSPDAGTYGMYTCLALADQLGNQQGISVLSRMISQNNATEPGAIEKHTERLALVERIISDGAPDQLQSLYEEVCTSTIEMVTRLEKSRNIEM